MQWMGHASGKYINWSRNSIGTRGYQRGDVSVNRQRAWGKWAFSWDAPPIYSKNVLRSLGFQTCPAHGWSCSRIIFPSLWIDTFKVLKRSKDPVCNFNWFLSLGQKVQIHSQRTQRWYNSWIHREFGQTRHVTYRISWFKWFLKLSFNFKKHNLWASSPLDLFSYLEWERVR